MTAFYCHADWRRDYSSHWLDPNRSSRWKWLCRACWVMSVGWNEQLWDNRAQMSQCWLVRLFEYVLQKDSFQTFAGIVFLIDSSCKQGFWFCTASCCQVSESLSRSWLLVEVYRSIPTYNLVCIWHYDDTMIWDPFKFCLHVSSPQVIIQNVRLHQAKQNDTVGDSKNNTPCHIDNYKTMQNERRLTNSYANALSENHELRPQLIMQYTHIVSVHEGQLKLYTTPFDEHMFARLCRLQASSFLLLFLFLFWLKVLSLHV